MMAQVTGLQPGEFVHSFGDVHLYHNHFEQARLQLGRDAEAVAAADAQPGPALDIFDFEFEDFHDHRLRSPPQHQGGDSRMIRRADPDACRVLCALSGAAHCQRHHGARWAPAGWSSSRPARSRWCPRISIVSPDEVRVNYEFRNEGEADDQDAGGLSAARHHRQPATSWCRSPPKTRDNIFGFQTRFNGEPVEAELHQYAFAYEHRLHRRCLIGMGVPLTPFGDADASRRSRPSTEDQKTELLHHGLVIPMEYDSGQRWQKTEYYPVWTLKSTYSWEADFPAGETVDVEHSYKPSVGGTVAVTFLARAV